MKHDNEMEEATMMQLLESPWPVITGYAVATMLYACMLREIVEEVRGE
ncbi:hypothetical protein [Kribbella italica]|uniref:Uncharacterized protein n=1 Tax=Kribbella italica TaxID=1540520 RepID=A0A7W9MYN4_9ACTN|nr:hypothetical protein [Kribbella italica]MBB5840587.1 hypothetical protein [Kribbella italica]